MKGNVRAQGDGSDRGAGEESEHDATLEQREEIPVHLNEGNRAQWTCTMVSVVIVWRAAKHGEERLKVVAHGSIGVDFDACYERDEFRKVC